MCGMCVSCFHVKNFRGVTFSWLHVTTKIKQLYLKLPVARRCMLPSTCLVLTTVSCTMETYEKECCVRRYMPTCDLAANTCAVSIRCEIIFARFFRGWNRPRNLFNNENFPIYGIHETCINSVGEVDTF